ncbi:MAG: leucine-rich repeat protein [Lachnospiraceae bacterium]|nr:leucine-rich repeat protein [Lachnospiraceae bacterium]
MKKNKKILSLVMALTMIFSMTAGTQTAWATGATITSASELYEGETGYDKAVITIEGDTFNLSSTGPVLKVGDTVLDYNLTNISTTQITVSDINKGGQALVADDNVDIFFGSGDVESATTPSTFTMTVKPTRDVSLDTTNPPKAKVGEAYSYSFTAIGMGQLKNYSAPTAEIPAGLSLSSEGELTGTPTTDGYYYITVTAENILTGSSDTHEYTLAIGDAPTISSDTVLYAGELGGDNIVINIENATFKSGAHPSFNFKDKDGNFISYAYGSGLISPTQMSISGFTNGENKGIAVGDEISVMISSYYLEGATTNTNQLTFIVQPQRPLNIVEDTVDEALVGEWYSYNFSTTGGVGYKTFAFTGGDLPEGIEFYTGGYLSGTPTTAGQYTFTLTATDGATPAATTSRQYTLNVKAKTTTGDYEYANGTIYKYTGNDENVVIPSEIDGMAINTIGEYAFQYNSLLKNVIIPDSIKTIGHGAFSACTNIKSIVIPDSVTSIERYAFGYDYNNSNLSKAIFLGDAPTLEDKVFYKTAADFKVYYLSSKSGYSADWKGYNCVPFDLISTYSITYNGNGNDGGTVPTDSAVYHTTDMATVLSSSISKTGYSFKCWNTKADGTGQNYDAGDLFTVGAEPVTLYAKWDKTYTITKDSAMKNGSLSVWLEGKEVSAAKEHEYVTIKVQPAEGYRYAVGTLRYSIEGEEGECYISSMPGPVTFKAKPKDDDSNSFGFMMTGKNIVITADFELTTNDYSVYEEGGGNGGISKYYGTGGNLIIPSKINNMNIIGIAKDSFYKNSSLTGVTLPDGLIYTGSDAFAGCDSLSAVVLPDSLEQIGSYCFEEDTMLKSIVIPSKVKTIGWYAFSDSDMLTSVCFEGDAYPTDWEDAFDDTNSDLVIYYKTGAQGFDVAQWPNHTLKEYKYLVKYNHNGATSGIVPSEHILFADGSIQVKANSGSLVKTGYTFAGWNTKADGTGTSYATGATVNVTGDMVLYAKWTVVSNGGNNSGGSSGGGSSSTTTTPITTPTTPTTPSTNKIEAKSDENGKASVTEKQVADAVEQAQKQGDRTVTIKVDVPSGSKFVETSIPKDAITSMAENMADGMSVSTPVAEIRFDKEALKTIENQATGDVKITVTKVETATLSEETKQLVGDRPVYNFSVTSGDKVISQFGGTVTVSVPYTPAENEDVNALVIFYINAEGKTEMVKDCVYDKETGTITFKTNHFSQYAVGYNKIEFNDVYGWYKDSVMYLASRDIVKGKADGYFMPNANITRAEFVQILANMARADLSKYTKSNFSDVNSNDWFMGAVAWANENGVASGADGKFNPNANITREDMAVMIERYVENVAKTDLADTTNSVEFADEIQIAGYAKTAVLNMQRAGIISGKDNNQFAPKANATRAEAAKMMASVMQSLI